MSSPYEGDSHAQTTAGLLGTNDAGGVGVQGTTSGYGPALSGTSVNGAAVFGRSESGSAVIGLAAGTAEPGHGPTGVLGCTSSNTDSGVRGDNTGSGVGVSGSSVQGAGVVGRSQHGSGIIGLAAGTSEPGHGPTGVLGCTGSGSDSGVWGDNTGGGFGVSGSSANGTGVFGQGGFNGVQGATANSSASGIWGANSGAGFGVGGESINGTGVVGLAGGAGAPGPGQKNGVAGFTASGSDSGVWGNNVGAGVGVSGSSAQGTGVIGQGGWNGVQGTTSNSAASGVWGENSGSGHGVGGQSASGIGIYGKGTPAGHFDGNVVINGGTLTMNGGGDVVFADFAEEFHAVEAASAPGTVMVIGQTEGDLEACSLPYDKRVAGVISGAGNFRPGVVLGERLPEHRSVPIALMGRVYCKVDARWAPIAVGDLLTTSATPGHAMKAADLVQATGAIIGKALRSVEGGQALIPILIALQ
jgi:hypothetical protein